MNFRTQVAWCFGLLAACAFVEPVSAQIATFQQGVNGYTGTQDTYFRTGANINNPSSGGFDFVTIDNDDDGNQSQGALRFDNVFQSQGGLVPDSGVLIGFAAIQLWIDSGAAATSVIDFNRVLPASPWDQATSTWFNLGGATVPDGTGMINGDPILQDDIESLAVANATVPDVEAEDQFIEIDVRTDFLEWFNDPEKDNNFGWGINNSSDNGWDFFSSEFVDVFDPNDFSKRPKLTVAWVVEPGDFDGDTDVDLDDYQDLLDNMAIQLDGPIEPGDTGDLDFDRDVDLDDFELFKGYYEDFNNITLELALAGVPEPTSAMLLATIVLSCTCTRSRRGTC